MNGIVGTTKPATAPICMGCSYPRGSIGCIATCGGGPGFRIRLASSDDAEEPNFNRADSVDQAEAVLAQPLVGAAPQFVHVGTGVMQGLNFICTARSKTMAKRIANALNNHKTNSEGV